MKSDADIAMVALTMIWAGIIIYLVLDNDLKLDVFFWNWSRYLRIFWRWPIQQVRGVWFKLGFQGGRFPLLLFFVWWNLLGILLGSYGWWRIWGRNFIIWGIPR